MRGLVSSLHFDGLMQERRNSSALEMELCLPCINPSTYTLLVLLFMKGLWTHHYGDIT